LEGSVLSGVGGFYTVLTDDGQRFTQRAQAKLRRQRMTPMVGDRIRFQPGEGDQHGWLEAILPRRNQLIRPPVANIDRIAIVVSAGTPEPDLMLVDRMLIFARMNGIEPLIVVNKCDDGCEAAADITRQYAGTGAQVFPACAATGEGLEALRQRIAERLAALAAKGSEEAGDVTARQASQLEMAAEALAGVDVGDPVLAANALRQAAEAIGRIVGKTYSDDLLDELFSRFCVGK